jgi:hypothetical protein
MGLSGYCPRIFLIGIEKAILAHQRDYHGALKLPFSYAAPDDA